MQSLFHPAQERGHVNFGWLDSHHSFSFGQWYDPKKVHFGALRVLNDDRIQGGSGFGTHPHDNMEIISIPLSGSLAHKDSTGTNGVIHTGDVQIMSAGTGIMHSEYNGSKTGEANFLQIWILPKQQGIKPHYDQKNFAAQDQQGRWQLLVNPDNQDGSLWINQDAQLSRVKLLAGARIGYHLKFVNSGVYLFVIEGRIQVANQELGKRDALGIWETDQFSIQAKESSEILAIEVPMLLKNSKN